MASFSLWDSLLLVGAKAHAGRQFRRFLHATHTAVRTQERVLLNKIAANADSDFGRRHDFCHIRCYQDFAKRLPVCTYETHRPYIERVMAGEVRALFGPRQRVLMFATTSGSTDKPKHIPVTRSFLHEYRRGWNVFGVKAMIDHPDALLRCLCQVSSPMEDYRTAGGLPCGSISGLLAATQKRLVRKYYAAPPGVGLIRDSDARYYTVMRFAVPRDVAWMVTASPATQIKLARTAAVHAERLIRDIHDGTLNAPGHIDDAARKALFNRLQPDPRTARRLTSAAERQGELLPRHYWNLIFLANWTGGTMGLHLRDFPHYFGAAAVRDIGLLATEGRVSIPLQDGTTAGVLDVQGSFFEFAETDAPNDDLSAVHRCHELSVAATYRVLMTTSAGLYRYDIGDHVRVCGYEGQAPMIEFLHRGAHVSSITGEKLTEWQVTQAFQRACKTLGMAPVDFVFAPVWAQPPYYRLHLDTDVAYPDRLARCMDDEIRTLNIEYASKQSSQRLGSIQPNRLPPGRLLWWDRKRQQGGHAEQYKHQYLYTNPGDDAPLCDDVSRSPSRLHHEPPVTR